MEKAMQTSSPGLPKTEQILLVTLSFLLVAFGQPAWSWICGLIAAICGYALFFRVLLCYNKPWTRFFFATAWFAAVQMVQLFWLVSHPYFYMYALYAVFAICLGAQFGVLGLLIRKDRIDRYIDILGIAGVWTLLEWSRLFVLSGFSWNPSGLALIGDTYTLQMASLGGVFALSFWVMFVNLLSLKAWFHPKVIPICVWFAAALFPYIYGYSHLTFHQREMANHYKLHAVVVQTTFAVEEDPVFVEKRNTVAHVMYQWGQILETIKAHKGKPIDIMVLPEYVVLCGTYTCVFPHDKVKENFLKILGPESIASLPKPREPLSRTIHASDGQPVQFVNNAYWAQAISNYFKTALVIGLEDVDQWESGERRYYSTAQYFQPDELNGPVGRYEKRVLVPMGEYIPFDWCKKLASQYGVTGSFTHGKEAKVFTAAGIPFGLSICYEETFGDLMRESKQKGAELLVNLTNNMWYPNSRLPWQHFYHALTRSVENGVPLLRSSNLGLSGAVDSVGNIVHIIGKENNRPEWTQKAMYLSVPSYSYQTLYSHVGDGLIVGFSFIMALLFFRLPSDGDLG